MAPQVESVVEMREYIGVLLLSLVHPLHLYCKRLVSCLEQLESLQAAVENAGDAASTAFDCRLRL